MSFERTTWDPRRHATQAIALVKPPQQCQVATIQQLRQARARRLAREARAIGGGAA